MQPVVQNIILAACVRQGTETEGELPAWNIHGMATVTGFVYDLNLASFLNTLGEDGWRVMSATDTRLYLSRVCMPEMPQPVEKKPRLGLGDTE